MSGGKSMYDELIADLRRHHCNAKEDDTQEVCDECAYDVIIADKSRPNGITSVCVCGLMNRAADALEELQKRVPKAPHGDLIDRDALRASIRESIEECHKWANEVDKDTMMYARISQSLGTFVECSLRAKAAPTIIPAEEGEK